MRKIGFLLILLMIAPFAIEIVFLADMVGVEFAILFAVFYLKDIVNRLIEKWLELKESLKGFIRLLTELYVFRPRIYFSHLAASTTLLLLTSSVFFACLIWLPPVYLSVGYFS